MKLSKREFLSGLGMAAGMGPGRRIGAGGAARREFGRRGAGAATRRAAP